LTLSRGEVLFFSFAIPGSLFPVRYSLFPVRYSLFPVRYSLFAIVLEGQWRVVQTIAVHVLIDRVGHGNRFIIGVHGREGPLAGDGHDEPAVRIDQHLEPICSTASGQV